MQLPSAFGLKVVRLRQQLLLAVVGLILMLAGLFVIFHPASPASSPNSNYPSDFSSQGFAPMLGAPVIAASGPSPAGASLLVPQPDKAVRPSQDLQGLSSSLVDRSINAASLGVNLGAISGQALPSDAIVGSEPTYITIPRIHLAAPVVPARDQQVQINGEDFNQWAAPDWLAAGWDPASAKLGAGGNTVLVGHHNEYGEVFRYLVSLKVGDKIDVWSGKQTFDYEVVLKIILPERGQPLARRLDNATWIEPTSDERLTLVTCWPYITNTHRLIIVAKPIANPISKLHGLQ